ncbi:MAG: hypothetical protein JRH20_32105, partial [Deltaproteobacteria bacterium]|nr:hypothetical protein [Deltaproteobacteria bacterium]
MEWLAQHLDRELFYLSQTPVTVLSLLVLLAVAFGSAYAGPLIRSVLRAVALGKETQGGAPAGSARKFGWFAGVFTPSILTILGVVMYLRMGW